MCYAISNHNFMSEHCVISPMTPTKIRERMEESDGRIDPETYVEALRYVRGER